MKQLIVALTLAAGFVLLGGATSHDSRRADAARSLGGLLALWDDLNGVGLYDFDSHTQTPPTIVGSESSAWSPDGQTLAYFLSDASGSRWYLVLADRSLHTIGTFRSPKLFGGQPIWTPDGTAIIHICDVDVTSIYAPFKSFCRLDIATGTDTKVTRRDPMVFNVAASRTSYSWLDDGRHLVFSTNTLPCETVCERILEADLETGEFSKLFDFAATDARVSPSGTRIAYVDWDTGNLEVRDVSGAHKIVLVRPAHLSTGYRQSFDAPVWAPDGKDIAFASDGFAAVDGNEDVFTVPATGGRVTQLTHTNATEYPTSWAPPIPACTIEGSPKNDTINGTPGDDVICGQAGNDTIDGKGGNDYILGGAGNDKLIGGDGEDTLLGEAGDDTLDGGKKKDALHGGDGKDTLKAKDGVKQEIVDGGAGHDNCAMDAGDIDTSCP